MSALLDAIREQERDDTHRVRHEDHVVVSLDLPWGHGESLGDHVGTDDSGELVLPKFTRMRAPAQAFSTAMVDPRNTPHGSIYAYRRLRCRCVPCTAAQAKAVREYRANRKEHS